MWIIVVITQKLVFILEHGNWNISLILNIIFSNPYNCVREAILKIVDTSRLDAFLANCNCKFEARNSTLLWVFYKKKIIYFKIVVLFVMFVLILLGLYTGYLVLLDSILRRQRQFIPYRRQGDDVGFSNTFWFRDSERVVSDDSETVTCHHS